MKKFYSLVLMATALLIGTNAWAVDVPFSGSGSSDLQTAINNAASGTKLVFQNNVTLTTPIWLGTSDISGENGAFKSIELDLNGHTIEMSANGNSAYYMFILTHGELIVNNGTISLTGSTMAGLNNGQFNESSQIFSVFGSYKSSYWTADGTSVNANPTNTMDEGYFTHLEIGENARIIASEGVLATAIAIDRLDKTAAPVKNNATLNYGTNIRKDGYGFAYGARVDVKGEIMMSGKNGSYVKTEKVNGVDTVVTYGYKCYGIKTNGLLASPLNVGEIKAKANLGFTTTDTYFDATYAPDAHKNDTIDAPFVYVHKNARIVTNNGSTRSTAIYSSGYAKYLIKGTCEGNVGVNIKSGKVILDDATIASTATTYSQATGQGGASGSGSAVVLNSTSYEGGMQVTISGDTKITANAGYAIEEVVNTQTKTVVENPDFDSEQPESETNPKTVTVNETKVLDIIFNGGTIEGGDKGAVVVSYETEAANQDQDKETTITVYGATVTGPSTVGKNGDLTDLLPTDDEDKATAHITVVTDPETGKKTFVVSEGEAPTSADVKNNWADVAAHEYAAPATPGADPTNPIVVWTGTGDPAVENPATNPGYGIIASDIVKLGELQMNAGTDATHMQVLVINEGACLSVQSLIMNNFAQIIVNPGGKLIVEAKQGIIAPVASNIVLQNENGKRSIFLFNPEVSSNTHPNATVELITNAWWEDANNLQWELFGVPTHNAVKSITCEKTSTNETVYAEVAVFENASWTNLGYIGGTYSIPVAKLNQPFAPYDLIAYCGRNAERPKVVMTGELVGNENADLDAYLRWTPFANSYTAELDLKAFLTALGSAQHVAQGIWVAQQSGKGKLTWNPVDLEGVLAGEKGVLLKLQPMQAFMLNNPGTSTEVNALNYKKMVYNPAMGITSDPAGAPRRIVANSSTSKLGIFVSNEEGLTDKVTLRENANNIMALEKYMNDDVNIYAMTDEKKAIVNAENIENTYVGFSTVQGGKFTISFANVAGREFDLIDHETGARVAVAEGNTYEFNADANSANDYRFEIVDRQNMPTAIDKTEAVKSVKGIYTITGQYVGEMNVWNTLPAGVYVVNGEKRVK